MLESGGEGGDLAAAGGGWFFARLPADRVCNLDGREPGPISALAMSDWGRNRPPPATLLDVASGSVSAEAAAVAIRAARRAWTMTMSPFHAGDSASLQ